MTTYSYLVTLVILTLYHVTCVTSWMDAPYSNQDFNHRVEYGENATLLCMDDRLQAHTTYSVQYWILPDLTLMRNGETLEFTAFDGRATWTVSTTGEELRATNVNTRQFGFYYCVMRAGGEGAMLVVKKAINYNGPYFGSRWPHYRMNVIIGVSAAGIFLILAIIFVILVKKFGASVPEKAMWEVSASPSGSLGYSNGDPMGSHHRENMDLKRRHQDSMNLYYNIRL